VFFDIANPGDIPLSGQKTKAVARHLLDRLAEIGINHLFGVPGDYNLAFLDAVAAHPEMSWVGTANGLNAAYAADGYARCRGAAALLTTFGVGELSAINGIAGSFAEFVPVLQIVGAPPTGSQDRHAVLHHTLGDGKFAHFIRMHEAVTVARADLRPDNAATEIDRVLIAMLRERRPGYIVLPTDVVATPVAEHGPLAACEPTCDESQLAAFAAHARQLLSASTTTAVLADFLVDRFGARKDVQAVIDAGDLPCATMMLGKGVLDESAPNFVATYTGAPSEPRVREVIEGADALITAGVIFTDLITAGFSQDIRPERLIDLQPFHTNVAGQRYEDVPIRSALRALARILARFPSRYPPTASVRPLPRIVDVDANATTFITQACPWDRVQRYLRSGDIVVADQGTASFGIGVKRLPRGVTFLSQPLWASIGYALPAAFGAGMALPTRRLIILTGDGSTLMTAQELGTMLRDGLKPVILLLNNNGYTIERGIHGPGQSYNDIPRSNWRFLARAMGRGDRSVFRRVEMIDALDDALSDVEQAKVLAIIEIVLGKHDVPDLLSDIIHGLAQPGVAMITSKIRQLEELPAAMQAAEAADNHEPVVIDP
jgi:indolepyruvate decarboxylase